MITRATLELRTLRTTLALRVLVHGVHVEAAGRQKNGSRNIATEPNSYPRLEFIWPNSCLGQCHPPGDRDVSTCPRLLINAEPPSYRVLTK